MIQEEYVTFETAKLLKEAGFPQDNIYLTDGPKTDDPLFVWYDNRGRTNLRPIEDQVYWNAPTQAQAMRWLREEETIFIIISPISEISFNGEFRATPSTQPPSLRTSTWIFATMERSKIWK